MQQKPVRGGASTGGGGGLAAAVGSWLLTRRCGQHSKAACLVWAGVELLPHLAPQNSWLGKLHMACECGRQHAPWLTPSSVLEPKMSPLRKLLPPAKAPACQEPHS